MFTNAQRATAVSGMDLLPMLCVRCNHGGGDDSGVMFVARTDECYVGHFMCQKCVNELGHGREASA